MEAVAKLFNIRLTDEVFTAWKEAADLEGVKVSEFVRRAVNDRIAGVPVSRPVMPTPTVSLTHPRELWKPKEFRGPESEAGVEGEEAAVTYPGGEGDAAKKICPACGKLVSVIHANAPDRFCRRSR